MRLIHQSRKEERLVDIVSSDTHIRRELNGNDTIEFFTRSKIDKEDYILRHVSEVLYEEYIVKSVTETREGFEVYAENSITELKTEVVPPQKMHLVNPSYPLSAILKNTRWAIGTVDPGYMMDFMSEEAYAYDLLKQIISIWPLEVETEINIDSTGKINRLIHLKNKIHREKGHRFEPGKGLSKVSSIIHDDEIYTAIKPLGDKYRSFHGRASAGSSRDIEVNKELSINTSGIGGFGDYLYRVEGTDGSGAPFLIQDYGGNESIKWTPTQVGNYKIIIKIKDIALDEVATLSADFYVKNKENISTSNKIPPIFTGDTIDDGEEHYLTIGPINDGDDWIYNEDARAEWGRKIPGQDARHRYGLIEIKVRDRSVLLDLAQTALVESSSPKVEYEADINDIKNDTRTKEPIRLGDICAVIDDELGVEIQSRIVAIDEEVESGKITATIANAYTNRNSLTGIISNAVKSQIQSFSLENNQRISELEKTNGMNDKFGETLPTDPYVGQLYYLYGQDGTITIMEYNGFEWIERLSDLTGEITKAKVESAQSSAEEAFAKAEEAINKIEVKLVNDDTGKVVGISMINDDGAESILFQIGDDGKVQITEDYFYIKQKLITNEMLAEGISANKITSGTLDASKANIINLNAANIVGQNADLIRGSFNAINSSINIDGTALTTKGNWGGDIKLSNRGLTVYDNLANREMGVLYGLFRNEDDPYADRFMLGTGLFAGDGYKLNLGLRNATDNANYSIISLGTSEEHGFYEMNVFSDILARYDLKMFGGMLTGAANAGYTVTEANGGHCIELANGWKIQFWRSSYQAYPSGWTGWTFPKRFTSLPRVVLAQAVRDDAQMTMCNAYAYNYQGCNIRIQDKTLPWTIVAIAIGN